MKDKIRIIFIPSLLALLGLIVIYTFLHWILFIKLELFGLKEIITNFGIPAILTGLVALILVRPKLKILKLKVKRGDWKDFYTFILWILLSVPLIIAQEYIVTASGELSELNSIDAIDKAGPTKFYTLKHYYIDKKAAGIHSAFDVSGKHNNNFNMHIYVALPIFEKEADTSKAACSAWLALDYNETISNRLEASEKESMYQEFATRSQQDFDQKDVSRFIYLNRIGNSDRKDGLLEAIKKNTLVKGSETILVPVNEPFEARNGSKLFWIGESSLIGLSIWFIMLLIPKINKTQLQRIKEGKPDKEAQVETAIIIGFLKPRDGFYITPILIYANLGIYILMMALGLGFISFKGQDLLNWGANYGPLTKSGDWWRLLTSTFLHGGLMHVLANMYGLLFVGIFLEPLLGRTKFLTAYLVTGIIGSVASIWWYEATISVGASGAIFGLYGVFLALLLTKVFPPAFGKAFLLSTLIFIAYNLLMGLTGGIDNAAHIGGLASGFCIGLLLYPTLKKEIAISGTE
jgi:rhomboid protease GluP